MPQALNSTAGFSLLGQLVTLALAGIMLAVAVPGYLKVMPRHRLNGAVRQLTGDLMWARMKAIQRNNRHRIFFLDDHRYRILDDADNDGAADPGEWTLTRDLRDDYPDVVVTSTNNPVFSPRGTASSLATITLRNAGGAKRVSISIAGRVRIR